MNEEILTEQDEKKLESLLVNKISNSLKHISKMIKESTSYDVGCIKNTDEMDWEGIISNLPFQEGYAVYVKNTNELSIGVVLLFLEKDILEFPKQIIGYVPEEDVQKSTIAEIGNIVFGQLHKEFKIKNLPTVPALSLDEFRGVLELPIMEFANESNFQYVVESDFRIENNSATMHMILMITSDLGKKILDKI